MNKWILSGYIGNDPEVRFTQSGQPVCNVRLATNYYRKKEDGTDDKKTDWHRLVAFGKTAELIREYAHKGSYLEVEARVQNRSWVDGQGVTRWQTEGVIERVEFGPKVNKVATTSETEPTEPATVVPTGLEDAPF